MKLNWILWFSWKCPLSSKKDQEKLWKHVRLTQDFENLLKLIITIGKVAYTFGLSHGELPWVWKDHDSWCFPFQFLKYNCILIQSFSPTLIDETNKRLKYKPNYIWWIREQKQACVKQALAKRKLKWYMIEDANWEKGFQKNFAQFCLQGNTSFIIRNVKNLICISTWDVERTIHGSALWNIK